MKRILLAGIILLALAPLSLGDMIKEPNVSGQFYDSNAARLSAQIKSFFSAATIAPSAKDIRIILAPHAGYIYSGPVAAYGFKGVSKKSFKTVVVLAPSHYFALDGVSIWPQGSFKTPLGLIDVDQEFAEKLIAMDEKFTFQPAVFEREHSLEVELPFLQETFSDFKVVPVIMGQPDYGTVEKFAEGLNTMIGGRTDVLVVVSSDLSHYHDDAVARKMDHHTIAAMEQLDAKRLWKQCRVGTMEMCGYVPATVALLLAKKQNLKAELVRYANSGDVTQDKSRVVGYSALIFYSNGHDPVLSDQSAQAAQDTIAPLSVEQKKILIAIAKQTMEEYVRHGKVAPAKVSDPRLMAAEGAFVTINKHGQLRGCIGNIVTDNPLYQTVQNMAIAAATRDPRFPAVTAAELGELDVEVSVLSQPRVASDLNEIVMGKHGVIVSQGRAHQGVFLPQVATEFGWDREEFLSNLCVHKAGLPADAWKDPKTKLEIFTADVFSEHDVAH